MIHGEDILPVGTVTTIIDDVTSGVIQGLDPSIKLTVGTTAGL
jgi:hypothetical protein